MEKITKHLELPAGEIFVSYQRGRKASHPTVVFLHGWGSNLEVWNQTASDCGFPSLAIDLPGFGKSEKPTKPLSVSDYVDVIEEIIERADTKEVVLAGHSFGGQVATALAAKNPDWLSGLLLVDSASLRPKKVPLLSRIGSLLSPVFSLPGLRSLRPFVYTLIGADEPPEDEVMKETMRNVLREDQSEELVNITVPTQIIWGNRDEATPLTHGKLIARAIPNAELVVLDGGHFIFLDRPVEFNDAMMSFINNLE